MCANLQAKRRAAAAAEAKPASWLASAHSLAEGRPALEVWQHIAGMVRLAKHLAGVYQLSISSHWHCNTLSCPCCCSSRKVKLHTRSYEP